MIHFVYVWCVIVFLVMVPKYVIDVAIIWLNDNIYSRNTWFPTTDVQTQNIGKPRYANRRAPTECRHTVATQATEYQRWRDVSCRSRRCRPMPTLGQRRNASWAPIHPSQMGKIMLRTGTKFWYHISIVCVVDLLSESPQKESISWLLRLRKAMKKINDFFRISQDKNPQFPW